MKKNNSISKRGVNFFDIQAREAQEMKYCFFILFLVFQSFVVKADDLTEQGVNYLFHGEFLGTLIGVKPISMLSMGLPRFENIDQSLQAALSNPEFQMALQERGIQARRILIRPDWNPSIEVAYCLILNKSEVEKTLKDSAKNKMLNNLGFSTEVGLEVVMARIEKMVESWSPRETSIQDHGILGIFLGYPVTAVESFLDAKENADQKVKKSTFLLYEGPHSDFKIGSYTTTRTSEDFELETKILQAKSNRAVQKIVADQNRGLSNLEILKTWNNEAVVGNVISCKGMF